jgi:hypothetical protein
MSSIAMDTTADPTGKTVIISEDNLTLALKTLTPQFDTIISAFITNLYRGALQTLLPKLPVEEYDSLIKLVKITPPELNQATRTLTDTINGIRASADDIGQAIKANKYLPPSTPNLPPFKDITPKLTATLDPYYVNKTVDLKDDGLLRRTTALRIYCKQVQKANNTPKLDLAKAIANPTSYASVLLTNIITGPTKDKKAKEAEDRKKVLESADPKDRAILSTLQALVDRIPSNKPAKQQQPQQPQKQQQQQPKAPKKAKDNTPPTPPQKTSSPPRNKSPVTYPFTPAAQKRSDGSGRFNVPFGIYRAHGVTSFNFALPSSTDKVVYHHYQDQDGKFVKTAAPNAKVNTPIKSAPKN